MKTYIEIEKICGDCLQEIVNAEPRESQGHSDRMNKTLALWAKDNVVPGGLTENCEKEFSWKHCPLCGELPGDRYEYNFIYTEQDESN